MSVPQASSPSAARNWLPRKGWQRLLLSLVAFKVIYFAVLLTALQHWPDYDQKRSDAIVNKWFGEPKPKFTGPFATWDALHYLMLADQGYLAGSPSCAFYPLWPITMRTFSRASGLPLDISGLILSNCLSLGAAILFFVAAETRFGTKVAYVSTALLVSFPGALFFQFVYSESLFFFLLTWLWLALERRSIWAALVPALALPLCRAIGVFCILPLCWYAGTAVFVWWRFRRGSQDALCGFPYRWLLLVFVPLGGWLTYFGLMRLWTGNHLAGFSAQEFWGVHSVMNLVDLPGFIVSFFQPYTFHDFKGSLFDRSIFLVFILFLPVVWRLGKDFMLWSYVLAIVPAMSGTFTSFTRFQSVTFPFFLALAVFLLQSRHKRVWVGVVTLTFLLLHGFLAWRFVSYRWAS